MHTDPEGGGVALPPQPGDCPRGIAVASSDYASTSISIGDPAGKTLRAAMLTSGSRSAGVSQALSGDVVLPSARTKSGEMVLIDRYPNAVLSFVDVATGQVARQLNVSTGFPSNPHDYLELGDGRALVSRYETNPKPGREPFDAGGDVLVIDARAPKIVGRVELARPGDGDFRPRPDRIIEVGREAWVLLQRFDASFKSAGDARVIAVDEASLAVTFALDLPGIANCGAAARSPSGGLVALACSGLIGGKTSAPERSAVVVLDATKRPPVEIKRTPAASAPFAPQIAFASEGVLVVGVYGSLDQNKTDALVTVDAASGAIAPLADVGQAFALGDVRCTPGCSNVCLVADAAANAIRVFSIQPAGAPIARENQPVDRTTGLPPRYFGFL